MLESTPDLRQLSFDVLNTLPEPVFWFDRQARFFEVNAKACEIWGYTREELLQKTVFDLNPNMSPEIWDKHWEDKQRDSSTFESSHIRNGGEEFPVDITDNFVHFKGHTYSCAIIRDITQRKITDQQARLSDFTVQKAVDAIFWLCPLGFIKRGNEEACRRYGYTEEEMQKMSILQINSQLDENSYQQLWGKIRANKTLIFETEHFTKAGRQIPVEVSAHHLEFEKMEYICLIAHDISERRQKEAAIRGALMEIKELKEKLEAENNYLQQEIELSNNFGEIISTSKSFKKVLRQIEQVADTHSTVLITGESGTGKELIARALHQLSSRSQRPMIKINCAALPPNLIESELFGHEKGAFTGAIQTKIGKFELADGGTLFLDEIGEMPIELQAKLLRALQEGEIERVGATEARTVDVRIIAATNRKLEDEIDKGKFRQDLYYRLNVFPIHSIPLRDRKEDIPPLVRFFCEKIGRKMGRIITKIPQKTLDRLAEYDFPGNVRELENIIERGIITSEAGELLLGNWVAKKKKKSQQVLSFPSLEEVQRQHIIKVLKHTEWRVNGEQGAAQILEMRPTTLRSKMDRLGIRRSREAID